MSLFSKLKALVLDAPPDYVFELSEAGIAWARLRDGERRFAPLEPGTLEITPLGDSVRKPESLAAAVRAIAPPEAGAARRRAALILPDYAARVAVLDFDTFPSDHEEQLQLARFRVKRAVPFDIDSAVVACHAQPRAGGSKKIDVVVAVINMDVASHLEAPFRAAGFHCGFVTVSALAALALKPDGEPAAASPSMVAKLGGDVLALSLLDGASLRMYRCVKLDGSLESEATDVLATSVAYAEDELGQRPCALRVCGVPRELAGLAERWSAELEMPVTGLTSKWGAPGAWDAGLAGYLEQQEALG